MPAVFQSAPTSLVNSRWAMRFWSRVYTSATIRVDGLRMIRLTAPPACVGATGNTMSGAGVPVGTGVATCVEVLVTLGLSVGVDVSTGVRVSTAVRVRLGVVLSTGVSVSNGVRLGVAVGIWDGVLVAERVALAL